MFDFLEKVIVFLRNTSVVFKLNWRYDDTMVIVIVLLNNMISKILHKYSELYR